MLFIKDVLMRVCVMSACVLMYCITHANITFPVDSTHQSSAPR